MWSETLALADSPEPLLRLSPGTVAGEQVRDGIHGLARLKPCKVGGPLAQETTLDVYATWSPLSKEAEPCLPEQRKIGAGASVERGRCGGQEPQDTEPPARICCHGPPRGWPCPDETQSRTWRVFLHITPQPSRPCNGPLTSMEASVSPVLLSAH